MKAQEIAPFLFIDLFYERHCEALTCAKKVVRSIVEVCGQASRQFKRPRLKFDLSVDA